MAQNLGLLTDQWMLDPSMFDPTQKSNQFSNFNNNPFPWPPTYNTGAGGPVNAATGQPIASFQQWQQANPAGVTLNQTPSQPQAPAASSPYTQSQPGGMYSVNPAQFPGGVNPSTGQTIYQANAALGNYYNPTQISSVGGNQSGRYGGVAGGGGLLYGPSPQSMGVPPPWAQQAAAPQQQAQGPPNNWGAALNALANPGNPVTQGATVPLAQGYQPAGGVNQAFLQNPGNQFGAMRSPSGALTGGGAPNPAFMAALGRIQGRPFQ